MTTADDTEIDGSLGALLLQIVFDGLRPPADGLPAVQSLRFGVRDLPEFEVALATDASALIATLTGAQGRAGADMLLLQGLGRAPVEATLVLADGSQITATSALIVERNGAWGERNGATARILLQGWRLSSSREVAAWIGYLHAPEFTRGNLLCSESGPGSKRTSTHNMRLEGTYQWHVLAQERGPSVVVIAHHSGSDLDVDALSLDFRALEFALGGPIKLDTLWGITSDAQRAAAVGLGFGFRPIKPRPSGDGPVPDRLDSKEQWIPALFAPLAASLRTDTETLLLALSALVDSRVDHLDGSYLKYQIAIEATCHTVLTKGDPRLLVADPAKWDKYVTSLADAIRTYARDPDAANKLLNKVKSAKQAPSTDVVEDGLAALGIAPPEDIRKEATKRNRVAHRYTMGSILSRDIANDVLRLQRLETLLVAVVAKLVGYSGPINGTDRNSSGWREVASWWPTEPDQPAALRTYRCSRIIPTRPEEPTAGPKRAEVW